MTETQSLGHTLTTVQGEFEEKAAHIEKINVRIRDLAHDAKIQQAITSIRALEAERDSLNNEFKNLSLQADERAKLDLKRDEVKAKAQESKTM